MFTKTLKTWMTMFVMAISGQAVAGAKFIGPGQSGTFYVTFMDECQYQSDSRAPKPFYVRLFVSPLKQEWSGGHTEQPLYVWLDRCDRVEKEKIVGRFLPMSITTSGQYDFWGHAISNYRTLCDLANATSAQASCRSCFSKCTNCGNVDSGLQFESDSADQQLRIEGRAETGREIILTPIVQSTGAVVQIRIDQGTSELTYFNSRGSRAFTQRLTSSELNSFERAVRSASRSCPVELTVSGSERKVIRVKSQCTDLGELKTGHNFG